MPDILQDLPIRATLEAVFAAVSTPEGLDAWWTASSKGKPALGSTYDLDFGPGYQWQGLVTQLAPPTRFELTISRADTDWTGTVVGFTLTPAAGGTQVQFSHRGWPRENGHYRVSCHCWALYLRLLRRHLEAGELVPYKERLNA